jgi:RNA polymerase sigma-70 factor (ECF subfamily)
MLERGRRANGRTAGSDAAFDAFYRVEIHSLVALATSLTGDRSYGADLAQEALLRAFRSWETVCALDRPGAWARRVVINLTIDAHRRRQREEQATRRSLGETSETSVPEDEVDEQFWAAVRSLPERQRHAVALHYIDDLPVAEVARVLEVTEGTVKTSLYMARKSLAARLGVADGGELR